MPLTPSQQAWADEQVGQERSVAHSGTVTKVAAGKGGVFVATVTDDDGRAATFELAAAKEVADAHRGETSTVLVAGTVTEVIEDPARTEVGLVVTGDNGTAVEWVAPPPMTEAEHAERYPVPTPEEQAAEQAAAEDRYAQNEKERLLELLASDADFRSAMRDALAVP